MSCESERAKLENVHHCILEVQRNIQLLTSAYPSLDHATAKLTPIEAAKLNVAMSYALATLYYVQKNIDGESLHKHPILDDLQRIKKYVQKVSGKDKELKAQAGEEYSTSMDNSNNNKRSANSEPTEQQAASKSTKKIKLKVDAKAAARIVKHNL